MRRAAAICGASLGAFLALAAPAIAQNPGQTPPDSPPPDCPLFDPDCQRLPRLFQDLERDLGPLFRDLERDVAPLLEGFGRRMEPYLRELAEMLGDLNRWEAPEILPNGDILIRRRPAPPPDQPPEPLPDPLPQSDPPVTEPFEL